MFTVLYKICLHILQWGYLQLGNGVLPLDAAPLADKDCHIAGAANLLGRSTIVQGTLEVALKLGVHILGDEARNNNKRGFLGRKHARERKQRIVNVINSVPAQIRVRGGKLA